MGELAWERDTRVWYHSIARADPCKIAGRRQSRLYEHISPGATVTHEPEAMPDREVQREVLAELAQDPRLRPNEISVHVQDGAVTLTGAVDSYMKRWAADRAVYRAGGVRSVVNHIEIRLPAASGRTDAEIAAAAGFAIESSAALDPRDVDVSVLAGVVTLRGAVEWNFQRDDAERIVRSLWGVTGVNNLITVRARAILAHLKYEIQKALARTVQSDETQIEVDARHSNVVLTGAARTWHDRAAAERVAWSAPGVTTVENKIVVGADPEPPPTASSPDRHAASAAPDPSTRAP